MTQPSYSPDQPLGADAGLVVPSRRVSTDSVAAVGRRTAGGAFWSLLSFGAARGLAFGTTLVLARLLSPGDFGLVSFAMIAIGLCSLLQDLGVPAAIVYGKFDIKQVGGTALTVNLLAALALLTAVLLGTPILRSLSGEPAIAEIVSALALGLVISAAGSVQTAILVKELAFRRKVIPEVVPLIVSGAVSISAALLGYGVWSLIYGYLARVTSATLLLWLLSNVRPWPEFRWPIAVVLLRYGRHVSFNSLVGVLASNIDYLIIGSLLGSVQLGLYTMAFVIAGLPSVVSGEVLAKTTFPAYAKLQGDLGQVVALFRDVLTLACMFAVPAGIALFLLAPAFMPILLGPKWDGVVEPIQLLVAYGVLRSIIYTFPPVYKAIGRPDIVWKLNLARLLVLAPAMWWGVQFGIAGVAMVQALVYALFVPINGAWLARTVGLSARDLWALIAPHAAAAGAVVLTVLVAHRLTVGQAAIKSPIGSILFTALMLAEFAGIVAVLSPRTVALARSGLAMIVRGRGDPLILATVTNRRSI
jgi:lipopolysaccharide exporter